MFCTNCGKEITGSGKFCSNCGAAVESTGAKQEAAAAMPSPAAAIVENDPDILTCPHCGGHNIEVSFQQTAAKTTVKKKGLLHSAARATMVIGTGGLWALTPNAKGKENTKFKGKKVAICQSCGRSWNI